MPFCLHSRKSQEIQSQFAAAGRVKPRYFLFFWNLLYFPTSSYFGVSVNQKDVVSVTVPYHLLGNAQLRSRNLSPVFLSAEEANLQPL